MAVITSPAATASATEALPSSWWLVDPLDSTRTISLNVVGFPTSVHESLSTHYPLGQQYPTVVADVVNGTDGQLAVETQTIADWQALLKVATDQRIKWLVSPYGDGFYIRIGGASPTMGISGQVHQTQVQPSPGNAPYRQATLQYVNVGMP